MGTMIRTKRMKIQRHPDSTRSEFKESGVHPPQLMPGTELEKPLGSRSTYCLFPPEYQHSRQEHYNNVNQVNGDNMPFDNCPPFPGPNMQSQQGSNGPLHDHVQEGSDDSEGSEDQNGFEKSMMDTMKAITRQKMSCCNHPHFLLSRSLWMRAVTGTRGSCTEKRQTPWRIKFTITAFCSFHI